MSDEFMPDGSRVYRHEAPDAFLPPQESGRNLDAVTGHLERVLGPSSMVLHEIVSDHVHVDVLVFPATARRRFVTLVTSGMSDRPMQVPEPIPERADLALAELVIAVPEDWFGDRLVMGTTDTGMAEELWWPVRLLKTLARFPHLYRTWLHVGHTVPNGNPPECYPGTRFNGAILGPPLSWDPGDVGMSVEGGRLAFLAVYPLHGSEMTLKLNKGADVLFGRLLSAGVTECVDPKRRTVAGLRRFLP